MTTNHPERLDDALIRPGRIDLKVGFTLASNQQIQELFLRMYCDDSKEPARQPTKLSQVLPGPKGEEGSVDVNQGHEKVAKIPTRVASEHFSHTAPPTPPMAPEAHSRIASAVGVQSTPALHTLSHEPSLDEMATIFAHTLPDAVFSPAEIQGYLLTRKNNPVNAVMEVTAWRDEELAKKQLKRAGKAVITGDGRGSDYALIGSTVTEKRDTTEAGVLPTDVVADFEHTRMVHATSDLIDPEATTKTSKLDIPQSGSAALLGSMEGVAEDSGDDDHPEHNDDANAASPAETEGSCMSTESEASRMSTVSEGSLESRASENKV